MKIYWTIDSIPELAPYTKYEKEKIWRDFYFIFALRKWETWLLALWTGLMNGLNIGGILYLQFEFQIFPTNYFPVLLIPTAMIGGGIIGAIFVVTIRAVSRPWLQEYLKTKRPEQAFSS